MSLLIFAAIVIIVLAIVVWAIDSAPFGDARIKWALKALAALAAVVAVLSRAGVA